MAKSPPSAAKKGSSSKKKEATKKTAAKRSTHTSATKSEQAKKRRSTTNKKTEKASTTPITPPPTHILIVDNGGDTIKFGFGSDTAPKRIPNVTARLKHQLTVLVGDEVQQMAERNPSQMYAVTRSTERGVVTNLGNQVQVWKRMLDQLGVVVPLDTEAALAFGWNILRKNTKKQKQQQQIETSPAKSISPALVAVLVLVPPHCPRTVLDQMAHSWMEDFKVGHVGFATSQICATQPHPDYQTGCLVDMGWSATHIVPTFRGHAIARQTVPDTHSVGASSDEVNNIRIKPPSHPTIRRIPLGGRHLVNIWKYYASYRQWNLMDQEWILRDVFQQLAYVSLDFTKEISAARRISPGRRPFDRNFVLPDYQITFKGRVEIPEALQRQFQQEAEDNEDEESIDEDFFSAQEDEDADVRESESDNDQGGDTQGENMVKSDSGTQMENIQTDKCNSKRRRSKRVDENSVGDHNEEEDDEDDDDNQDLLRQRLLRQKGEEERRRRELELEQQVLMVSVERFSVPEVLFYPSDAGLPTEMAGLPQAIAQAIFACPVHLKPALYQSIQFTGGVTQLPNMLSRLERELRAIVPDEFQVKLSVAAEPIDQAWLGARQWAQKTPYAQWSLSRDEWDSGQKSKAWLKALASSRGALV